MYILVDRVGESFYDYHVYAANNHEVLVSENLWRSKSACIRAAKKMARRLGIEYREVE